MMPKPRACRSLAMGTAASLYLSIMVMKTLPDWGRRWPAAMAALAYALPKVTSMPITCTGGGREGGREGGWVGGGSDASG